MFDDGYFCTETKIMKRKHNRSQRSSTNAYFLSPLSSVSNRREEIIAKITKKGM